MSGFQTRSEMREERRRSVRVLRTVPLVLSHADQRCDATSFVISANGALVLSELPFFESAALVVTNATSGADAATWVIATNPAEEPGRFVVSFEFAEAAPDFWGEDYSEGSDPLP